MWVLETWLWLKLSYFSRSGFSALWVFMSPAANRVPQAFSDVLWHSHQAALSPECGHRSLSQASMGIRREMGI